MGGVIFAMGVPSGLSFGIWAEITLGGMNIFDFVDNIASNYLLPLGGMFTAIFVGWVWGIKSAKAEVEKSGETFRLAAVWGFILRYVTPVCVALVFVAKFLQE